MDTYAAINGDPRQPLLGTRTSHPPFGRFAPALMLMTIFLCGFFIAIYLLIQQGKEWTPTLSYFLVHRSEWENINKPNLEMHLYSREATCVIITDTDTVQCNDINSCYSVLKILRDHSQYTVLEDFNFLIGSNGVIYEGIGYDMVANNLNLHLLSIGFIGNFNKTAPNEKQLTGLDGFLNVSVRFQKLNANYKLIVQKSNVKLAEHIDRAFPGIVQLEGDSILSC